MSDMRCAVLDDYQDVALAMADWSRVRAESFNRHIKPVDELVTTLRDFEIVVAMRERTPMPAAVLERLPKLRLLVTTGMRNASIDLAAAAAQGIVVSGTRSLTEPTVELTWALILGLARGIIRENHEVRTGGWQAGLGTDLAGATLGLIGLGKIGSRVARVGTAFGMNVLAWSQNLTPERASAAGARLVSKDELLAASDFVSVHVVLSDRTRGLLDSAALGRMRSTAYLVNTSRAAVVDQKALVAALESSQIAGAGLDVFDVEPLPPGHPFRDLPNVLATPHIGYVSRGNYAAYFSDAVEDIEAFLSGSPIRVLNAT